MSLKEKKVAGVAGNAKAVTALVLVLLVVFCAACVGFGVIPTLLAVVLAASAAILTALVAVSLTREGY